MRIAKRVPVLAFALALVAYGFDCPQTSTPDEAMQCCDTMQCSSHGHDGSEDCCKTMQATHPPFVKQSPSQGAHLIPVLGAFLPTVTSSQGLDISREASLATYSHAPPISP